LQKEAASQSGFEGRNWHAVPGSSLLSKKTGGDRYISSDPGIRKVVECQHKFRGSREKKKNSLAVSPKKNKGGEPALRRKKRKNPAGWGTREEELSPREKKRNSESGVGMNSEGRAVSSISEAVRSREKWTLIFRNISKGERQGAYTEGKEKSTFSLFF